MNIGCNDQLVLSESKQQRLLNIYALTWIHLSSLYLIIDSIFGSTTISMITHVVNIVFMSFVLFLSSIKKQLLAKILWLIFAICSLCFYSVKGEPGHYVEFFILFFPASSLCLFTKNTVGYISIPFAIVAFLTPYYLVPVYPSEMIANLGLGFVVGFIMCIFLLVLYFKKENLKNENLLLLEKDKVLSDKIILEHQQQELQELNKFKSHFFVNLSHEIRTPLTLIKGYVEQIDLTKTIIENEEHIAVINNQLNEIKKITDDIIDLSKLDENKIILNRKPQSINLFLEKIFADFKPLFVQHGINFNLQQLVTDIDVSMDFHLIARSFSNIINNALKFTANGGVVNVKAIHSDRDVSVNITDTGIGIQKEDLHKIFDRFYQSKNDITKSQGSGIGLTFSKNIIEAHGFSIEVASEYGKGSVFKIKFPESSFVNTQISERLPSQNDATIKKTILLVDDHHQMRQYLKRLLGRFNVIEASNGLEALEVLKKHKIDLLLTDYMMPVMNGWDLVNKVRVMNKQIPVFIITARADHKGKLDMLRLGIDHYFTKPFNTDELLLCVDQALGYYRTLQNEYQEQQKVEENLIKHDEEFKNKIEKILLANISSYHFGVEDIAEIFQTSSKTLTRKTKLYFGQTPNQMIIEARLLKAKQILDATPEISIRELAKQVGMKNSSYLKKRFDERF